MVNYKTTKVLQQINCKDWIWRQNLRITIFKWHTNCCSISGLNSDTIHKEFIKITQILVGYVRSLKRFFLISYKHDNTFLQDLNFSLKTLFLFERQRDSKCFHPLVHPSNSKNGQSCAGPKPRTRSFFESLPRAAGVQGLGPSQAISRELNLKRSHQD